MGKVIAAINMSLDGNCDHLAGLPDDRIHDHYTALIRQAGIAIYGRKTYQLMEYWREVLGNPTGNRAQDDFAVAMDRLPKIVFSRSLKSVDWHSARLADKGLVETVRELKGQKGGDILVGSPGLIVALLDLGLIDELQVCIYPLLMGKGPFLFKDIVNRKLLRLGGTKSFEGGAVLLYYGVHKEQHP